jgi:hypothetical protein
MDRMGHSFTYGMHTDPQAKSSGEIEGGNENHAALQGRHDTFGKEGVGPCATRKSLAAERTQRRQPMPTISVWSIFTDMFCVCLHDGFSCPLAQSDVS